MDKFKIEKRSISPNKIVFPINDKENGVLDEYIQTADKSCLENFTCCICACLAWDPVCCPKCDKPFCRACIIKYGKTKLCPFKCEINSFREITRNEKSYLNKIKIKCTNVGCSKYVPYSDYVNHLEKCVLRKYHCKNYPCKEEGYIKNMINHIKECPHRLVECSKCKQSLQFCEMKAHQQEVCPEITVKCKYCKCPMKRGIYLKEHLSESNENSKCLKLQVERWAQMYNDDINLKNNEINDLKNKIKEMEKKQKIIENENMKLKKNSEEIKNFFKKTYTRFFSEENEKVVDDDNKKKETDRQNSKEYTGTENNFFNKNKANKCIYNKNELNINNNNSYTERRRYIRIVVPEKSSYIQDELKNKLFQGKKNSSMKNSKIKSNNIHTYDKDFNSSLK